MFLRTQGTSKTEITLPFHQQSPVKAITLGLMLARQDGGVGQ